MHGDHLEAGSPEIGLEFRKLLTYLSSARGFDFRGYKIPSLIRRLRKRMDPLGVESFSSYQDYLQAHPNELAVLFNTIFINVTGFFRDPVAWDAVRSVALPPIVAGKRPKRRLFRKGPTVGTTARHRPAGGSHPLGTSGRKTRDL